MQSDLLSGDTATHHLRQLRERSPLVHCITNDVVQAFTANVLLALGASPAMVIDVDEAAQFSALADSLLINTGTLTRPQMAAMKAAIASANRAGKPWTLDPVAVGALRLRTEFAREIIALHPAAIRGNASEIMALAGLRAAGRGVDSGDSPDAALEAAVALARSSGAVVAVTGEVDYITDGNKMRRVAGGTPLMTRVVGTGCALSAVVAAFTSLPGERLDGVASACWIMKHAGSLARERVQGPGSFAAVFVDMLYTQAFGEAE